jgi:type I restriction enzyme S subunit
VKRLRFKQFLTERNQLSKTGEESLLSVSEYYGVKPRAEAFEGEEHETRAATLEGYRIVRKDDLVMNYMLAWKGAYGTSNYDGIVSPAYSVFRINQDIVDVRYLHHRVRSDAIRAYFRSRSKGIIESRLRLYPDMLLASFIEIPDLPAQRAIADFLDRETARIDLLIEKKRRLLDLLGEKIRSDINDLFKSTGGKTWRIRHLGTVKNGAGFPLELQGDSSNKVPFFKVKHLKVNGLDQRIKTSDDTVSIATASMLRAIVFPEGTIVFAKIGAALMLGRFSMLGTCGCVDNNLSAFIVNRRLVDPDYLLLCFERIEMTLMVQPGAVPSLSTERFINNSVSIPSIPEQRLFVSAVREKVNINQRVVERTQVSIDRLREYRSALITAAVTGQIDVTKWVKAGTADRKLDAVQATMNA